MNSQQQEKLINCIKDPSLSMDQKIKSLTIEIESLKELPKMKKPISMFESIQIEEKKRTPEFILENRIVFSDQQVIDVTGPFFKKELVVLAGRPAMGKTQLLVHWANLIAKNQRVLFHSLDCSISEITNRFLANETGILIHKINENKLETLELEQLQKSKNQFKDKGIFLVDSSIKSLNQLKAYYKEVVKEQKIDVIFIDYLQLYSGTYNRNREQEISTFMRSIKEIANDLNVCIFLASQLSRSVEYRGGEKRPFLSDLRESGSIEEFADKVFFIYRPEYYGLTIDEDGETTVNSVEIIIAKNKLFGVNTLYLERDPNFTHFNSKPIKQSDLTWDYKIEGMDDVF